MPRSKLLALSFCLLLGACAGHASPEDTQMANNMCAEGKALLAARKTGEARDLYASAVRRDPDNARAWNGLGVAQDLLGKTEEARDAYQHAIDLAPDDLTALNNLAHLEMTVGDANDAVALLAPHESDPNVTPTLKQNLATARKLVQTQQDAQTDYADLGSSPTAGMADAHAAEARKLLGSDAEGVSFTTVPEVKVTGGTPVFTLRATGKPPQEICDVLNANAFPCVTHGK